MVEYVVNATYNWWDAVSGPYHFLTNPTGTGDNVSANVLYHPWLTEQVVHEQVEYPPSISYDGTDDRKAGARRDIGTQFYAQFAIIIIVIANVLLFLWVQGQRRSS